MNNQTRIQQIGNQPTTATLTHDYPTLNDDLAHWDNNTNQTVTVGQFVLTPGLKEITATGPINIFCNNWNVGTYSDYRASPVALGTQFPKNADWTNSYKTNYCCVFNARSYCVSYIGGYNSTSQFGKVHTWYDLCS